MAMSEAVGRRGCEVAMRIATINVNGINCRLSVLLSWLKEARPNVVCLHELRTEQEKFPEIPIRQSGYSAIWQGEKGWNGSPSSRDKDPIETRRSPPGDPNETHSRYIEAAVDDMMVGCL
jgi:exodeoxyribonuclease III